MNKDFKSADFRIPDHIPTWCRLETYSHKSVAWWERPHILERYKKLMLAESVDVLKAWRSLDKRAQSLSEESLESFGTSFLYKVLVRGRQLPAEETLSISERTKLAEDIEAAAATIKNIVDRVGKNYSLLVFAHCKQDEASGTYTSTTIDTKNPLNNCTLSEALDIAVDLVQTSLEPTYAVIERPASGDAVARFFCHELTYLFKFHLKQPLYAVTASLASVVFDETYEPDYVRLSAKDTVARWQKRQKYLLDVIEQEKHK